ncbi:MAG: ATP-binding protein [Bacteroidales bacterium]|nr:ATP-binding protein [Bacteroidales bacterium]
MARKIIGRKREILQLENIANSDKAELVAVYGRRRIGKTYLVKEFFNEKFDYYATGIFEGSHQDEIDAFCDMLYQKQGNAKVQIKTWMDAFIALRDYLKGLRKKRVVVFLDELPWFDVPSGKFLKAFEWFWNSWGSTQDNLKMIVCGSATTWMTDKFISGKGGLYNRTTERIYLAPFDLNESEALLHHCGIDWERSLILDAYMIFGGVPLYLSMLKNNKSLDENIDDMYFREGAPLRNEYDFLFRSLFKESDFYMRIVDAISSKNMGVTRQDIVSLAKVAANGTLTTALKNLISCDFIRKYNAFGKKERAALYQLTDLSILFYKRFVEKYNGKDDRHWTNLIDSPTRRAWTGIAFEQVCLLHIPQIKMALGISGVQTEVCSWRFAGDEYTHGIQIDMLLVRRDKVINLCEMKYSAYEYEITSKYSRELRERCSIFKSVTKTNYALHITFVTPWGVKLNANGGISNSCITNSDLFAAKS